MPQKHVLSFCYGLVRKLKQRKILSKSKFNKFCKDNFISTIRFIEWMDLAAQLRETLIQLGYKITEIPLGVAEGV